MDTTARPCSTRSIKGVGNPANLIQTGRGMMTVPSRSSITRATANENIEFA